MERKGEGRERHILQQFSKIDDDDDDDDGDGDGDGDDDDDDDDDDEQVQDPIKLERFSC